MSVFNRIPKNVQVKDRDYKVQVTKHPGDDKSLDGCIWYDDRIELAKHLDRNGKESTLLHEVLHGICRHYKMNLSEKTILKLEEGLFETFKKNGWKISLK